MNRFLAATFLSAAMLFSGTVQAMDINHYFNMANQDQGRFDQTLLTGAEKLLIDEGRADLATQLDKIFTEVKPGNKLRDARPNISQGLVPCKSPRSTEKS